MTSESGINILQPGQVEPTLAAGMRSRTAQEEAPRARAQALADAEPPPGPWSQALDVSSPRMPPGTRPLSLEPPQRTRVATGSTQGAMPEPPLAQGRTRLYKGDPRSPQAFTTDRATAERYGPVRHVDVSPDELQRHFQPGEGGQYLAHPTLERVYNRRLRDTQPVLTEPVRRGELAPGEPPTGVRMAPPDLEARLARAMATEPAQAAAARTGDVVRSAPAGREMIHRTKAGDTPVRVSNEPPKLGKDGLVYQKVSYKGRDYYARANQLVDPSTPRPRLRTTRGTITEPLRRNMAEQVTRQHGGLEPASEALIRRIDQRIGDIQSGRVQAGPGEVQRLAITRKQMAAKGAGGAGKPPGGGKPQVRTHDGAIFTGATVHEAAVFARGAGYRPHQIFNLDGTPYKAPKATPAPAVTAKPAVTPTPTPTPTPPKPFVSRATPKDLHTNVLANIARMLYPRGETGLAGNLIRRKALGESKSTQG